MSWRTSLAGLLAGLSFISAALAQPGPWTVARALAVAAGVLVAVLGVAAVDAGRADPLPAARMADPPNPDAAPRVVLPSFEDAARMAQPNARGDK